MRECTRESKLLSVGTVKSVLDMLAVARNLREYTLEKPLKCGYCEKCFTTAPICKQHGKMHEERKVF